jgi:hypothetical protein
LRTRHDDAWDLPPVKRMGTLLAACEEATTNLFRDRYDLSVSFELQRLMRSCEYHGAIRLCECVAQSGVRTTSTSDRWVEARIMATHWSSDWSTSARATREAKVVVLVGFPILRRHNRLGLFERCGLHAMESCDLENTCDLLQRLVPDAIVLDTHNPDLQRVSASLFRLLALSTRSDGGAKPKVLVLSSSRLSQQLRYVYGAVGAIIVPCRSQKLRPLIRIVRQGCGLLGDCCAAESSVPIHGRSQWRLERSSGD